MFDIVKRKHLSDVTVGELINELNKLPSNAKVFCCGDSNVWLNVEKDNSIICIDSEDLEECYIDED